VGLLTLDNLSEKMVLKSAVHDRSGRLLLGGGIELTARHLRMLRMWGVLEADIESIDDQVGGPTPSDEIDPVRLAAAENELRGLFRNTDLSSPVMGELFRLCLLRKVCNESR